MAARRRRKRATRGAAGIRQRRRKRVRRKKRKSVPSAGEDGLDETTRVFVDDGWKKELRTKLGTSVWKALNAKIPY